MFIDHPSMMLQFPKSEIPKNEGLRLVRQSCAKLEEQVLSLYNKSLTVLGPKIDGSR